MKALKYALPLSLALVCGSAVAASGDSKPKFDQLDANSDDRISMKEAREHAELSRHFEKLDKNGNQKLSRNEYRKFDSSS